MTDTSTTYRCLTEAEVRQIRKDNPGVYQWNQCVSCGSEGNKHEVRNHDLMWHDGDVHCLTCGSYVRMYDAG